jgi:hypothetical protein
MDGWATFQTLRQRNEDLRREAEIGRLARALRKVSPKDSWWLPVAWWERRHRAYGHELPAKGETAG